MKAVRGGLPPVARPMSQQIIPCLDEEAEIAGVMIAVFAQGVSEVVVVDGGSQDETVERATAAGARIIVEPQRGYGRAIQAGIAAVHKDAVSKVSGDLVVGINAAYSMAATFVRPALRLRRQTHR